MPRLPLMYPLLLTLGIALASAGCFGKSTSSDVEEVPPTPPVGQQNTLPTPTPTPAAPPASNPGTSPAGSGQPAVCTPQQSLAPLVERLQPSVVNIYTTKLQAQFHPLAPFFSVPPQVTKERALGSGFVYDAREGLIVTNAHVVAQANEVRVRLSDRRELNATLLGSDSETDLALLRTESSQNLQQVQVGDSDRIRVGDWVVAIGNPFGLSQTVTVGIVSALSRTIGAGPFDDFIQTDASINPGNSGGPLFDMEGRVVGINTAIHREGQGIGFAIPMNMAQPLLDQIRTAGRVERVHLGVVIQDVPPDVARALGQSRPLGALVASVVSASPAAQAGIQTGDVIVEFNGHPIEMSRSLPTQVARTRPGAEVPIVVLRSGQRLDLRTRMESRPPDQAPNLGQNPAWPGWPPTGQPVPPSPPAWPR